jgi:hypothetical protein
VGSSRGRSKLGFIREPCNPPSCPVSALDEILLVVVAEIEQGRPIRENAGKVSIPRAFIEDHETVYRFRGPYTLQGIDSSDILIAAPRNRAATGELVIATLDTAAYLGTWWTKHGTRQLMGDGARPVVSGKLRIKAVVNLIIRKR